MCVSDTHELHRQLTIPRGDIFVHAGDFTMFGKRASQAADFDSWLGELPHPVKLVIPGNHEFYIEEDEDRADQYLKNATVLINQGIEAFGLKIWGSPLTDLYGGAFGRSSPDDLRRIYKQIPAGVDVLITHGPPHGILDRDRPQYPGAGYMELRLAVASLKPILHVFGHIHGGYGLLREGGTIFANAAMLTDDGDVEREPLVIDLEVQTRTAARRRIPSES